MKQCHAEKVIAGVRVSCGNEEGHAGPHAWEELNAFDVETMAATSSYHPGDVLVIQQHT
jgi:hypothetical protein